MLYKKKLDTCFDTHGIKIGVQLWRRRWDSNPRAVARKLISSQPRYDHFDTSPYSQDPGYYISTRRKNQGSLPVSTGFFAISRISFILSHITS